MGKIKRYASFLFLPLFVVFTYVFMYVPIVVLVVYSFNKSSLPYMWTSFSVDWYRTLFYSSAILDAFKNRKDAEYFTKLVNNEKVAEKDYNLAVSGYVIVEDTSEVIDIVELNKEICEIEKRQSELRTAINKIVIDIEGSRNE